MKYNPSETLEQWGKRVELYEYGSALQELANKKDIEKVMSAMAERIINKMMHPIMVALNDKTLTEVERIELEVGRIRYQREYLDRFAAKPDHILDDVAGKQQSSK